MTASHAPASCGGLAAQQAILQVCDADRAPDGISPPNSNSASNATTTVRAMPGQLMRAMRRRDTTLKRSVQASQREKRELLWILSQKRDEAQDVPAKEAGASKKLWSLDDIVSPSGK
jgi:hypothetical protein